MKIAVFSNLWPPVFIGGYEIGASQVVNELKRRGHEVLLLACHEYYECRPPAPLVHQGHAPGDRAHFLDAGLCLFGSLSAFVRRRRGTFLRQLVRTWWARRRYRAALRGFRPDVLLAFNPLGVLAPVLDDFVAHSRETGAPVQVYVSDHWLAGWPGANPLYSLIVRLRHSPGRLVRVGAKVASRLLSAAGLLPRPLPLVDRYLYCSDFIRSISQENSIAVARHEVVRWGLPDAGRLPGVRPDHFDTGGPLTVVYAGQLLEHKGLAVLVRALARCKARHPLVVIGDDRAEYAEVCRKVARKLGVLEQIRFLGKKKNGEMLELLSRSGQVLVVPSLWDEPFSIVVLEGMGVGLPVVASNTGGTGEAIADGETGFLFPRGNDRELAAVLDRLDADRPLCRQVGARARKLVLQRFTLEAMVDQVLAGMPGGSGQTRKAAA